ncbi:YktB family protein [Virgibacillus sp. W0181]|uniref:YktB family protein n=1 Tax=Virgibacillus sp. W0181 TaxID=3391581 RepID=UPI003F44F783
MDFKGFSKNDFETFEIDGLEQRMEAIQQRIQPKFKIIGDQLSPYLSDKLNQDMYLHIARHARRTKNAPEDTWAAFSHQKRGYKKHPHFQVGLWNDRVFIWLAFIYELPNKSEIANVFIEHEQELANMIPTDFFISMDHMKKGAKEMDESVLSEALTRFKTVKKSELLIGKQYPSDHPLLQDGLAFINEAKSIYERLMPVYQLAFKLN